MNTHNVNRRQIRRFKLKIGSAVKLVFNQQQIYAPVNAAVVDDSFNGCGLLVDGGSDLVQDESCLILIDQMKPIQAAE
ncbi:MAG: hypothetical protein WBM32_17105 [Crocosphaera sp.]|jgi:hypothetical protein